MKHQTAIEGFACLEKIGGLKMISNFGLINDLFAIGITIFMAFFAYMSCHIVSEKKARKTLPLPWEKGGFFRGNK